MDSFGVCVVGMRALGSGGPSTRWIARALAAVLLTAAALVCPPAVASAAPPACPDVQVLFARGTFEPPGIGVTGLAFVNSLRAQLPGKSVDVYPVKYPASLDFETAADGVIDASNKVRDTAATCPNTAMVLGGYSQGAAVMAYITEDSLPDGYTLPPGITGPMPPEVADHVAAVALFGKPSGGFLNRIEPDAPPIRIGDLYAPKTIDMCVAGDPICSPAGNDNGAHGLYAVNGMAAQAADFAARRIDQKS